MNITASIIAKTIILLSPIEDKNQEIVDSYMEYDHAAIVVTAQTDNPIPRMAFVHSSPMTNYYGFKYFYVWPDFETFYTIEKDENFAKIYSRRYEMYMKWEDYGNEFFSEIADNL